MSRRTRWNLAPVIAALLCTALAAPMVEAATLSLKPIVAQVALGEQVLLSVEMDFSDDPTIGGGFDIFFEPSFVRFVSFSFDAALGDDPAFRSDPQGLATEVSEIGFGNFAGISGPAIVGTVVFDTLAAGTTRFTLADNDSLVGPFFSAATSRQQLVTYEGADVGIAAVPLPPSVLLLTCGLIGLGVFRRR